MEKHFLNCHTEEAVKIRWRSLSKQYHPDVNKEPNAKEIFQEIEDERAKTLKSIWQKQGKNDQEIDIMLMDLIKDPNAMRSYVDQIVEKFSKADKPPSSAELFKHIFNDLMGKETKKNDQGKLDQ